MIFDDVILRRNSDVSESPSTPSTPSELNSENLEKINFTAEVSDLRALVRERSILSDFIPLGMEDTQEGLLYYRVGASQFTVCITPYKVYMTNRCYAQWEYLRLLKLDIYLHSVPFLTFFSFFSFILQQFAPLSIMSVLANLSVLIIFPFFTYSERSSGMRRRQRTSGTNQ